MTDDDALWAAFKYFDHDNDDMLSFEDINKTMRLIGTEMSPIEITEFMLAFNEGTLVDFESFKALIESNSPLASQCSPIEDCRHILRNNPKNRLLLYGSA